jgi:hypothetical protein
MLEILRRIKEEGVSVAQAAKDAGISEPTIYDLWGKEHRALPPIYLVHIVYLFIKEYSKNCLVQSPGKEHKPWPL